jgi:hypothetical protein
LGRRALSLLLPLLIAAVSALAAEKAPAPGTPAPPPGSAAVPAGPVPVLAFESQNLDLGAIPEGQDAIGTFVVRNSGQAELRLIDVKPG